MNKALRKAIKAGIARCGSKAQFARELGIKPQSLQDWTHVPYQHVLAVADLTGVSPHELRPDLYPKSLHYDAAS